MDIFEGTNTHLAKVYFFDHLEAEIRSQQLLEYEINNRNYLKKLRELKKDLRNWIIRMLFSTLYYGICITEETIRWCRHIRMQKPLTDLLERER